MSSPNKLVAADKEFCRILADQLEIQADGGDDAGEFVSYAIEEARKKMMVKYYEQRIKQLKEPPNDAPQP